MMISKDKPRYSPDSKKVKEVEEFENKKQEDMKEPSKSKPKPAKKTPVYKPKPVQDSYRDEPLPDVAKKVKSAPEEY